MDLKDPQKKFAKCHATGVGTQLDQLLPEIKGEVSESRTHHTQDIVSAESESEEIRV